MKCALLKKAAAAAAVAALCLTGWAAEALAAEAGIYTAPTITSYLNPETGKTEDGGSQNTELGEGMCRSAVGETALVEVDANGDTWVTMRMLLYSNLSKIKFQSQSKAGGAYAAVSASIMAEDAANDSADYRMRVPSAGCNMKTTMYVAPMGRDVTFFWHVDTSNLKSGSGDFVVTLKDSDLVSAAPEPEVAPAPEPVSAQQPAQPEPANTPAAEPIADNTVTAQPAAAGPEANQPVVTEPDSAPEQGPGTMPAAEADPAESAETDSGSNLADSQPAEPAAGEQQTPSDTDEPAAGDADVPAGDEQPAEQQSNRLVWLAAAVAVVAAAAVVLYKISGRKSR